MQVDVVSNLERAIELFSQVAGDPISAVLVALGGLFVAASVVVLGALSVGGLVSAIGRYAASSGRRG